MKKLALAFILVLSVILLIGCGSDGAPDGMQLVSGGPELGYYFYAPEEWTVSNTGDISSVYVSRIDTTSVSFAEIDPKSFLSKGRATPFESHSVYGRCVMTAINGVPVYTDVKE